MPESKLIGPLDQHGRPMPPPEEETPQPEFLLVALLVLSLVVWAGIWLAYELVRWWLN
jgi:hypothetical protein